MDNTHGAEPKGVSLGALLLKDEASCPIKSLDKEIDSLYTISIMIMPNRYERTGTRSLNDNLRSLDKNIERFRGAIKVNPGYSFRLSEVKPKNFWDSSGRMCVDTT